MKRGVLFALIVGLGAALLAGPAAFAQQYPPPCNVLEVDADVKVGGDHVKVHVCGVRLNSMMNVGLAGTEVAMNVPVNGEKMDLSVPIPANLAPGTYTLTATGIDDAGKPVRFEVPITVLDPGSPAAAALKATQTAEGGPVAVAPGAGVTRVFGKAGATTRVKGVQMSPADGRALVASQRTPAALKFAGMGLLSLLALSGLGAVGYTAFARIKK